MEPGYAALDQHPAPPAPGAAVKVRTKGDFCEGILVKAEHGLAEVFVSYISRHRPHGLLTLPAFQVFAPLAPFHQLLRAVDMVEQALQKQLDGRKRALDGTRTELRRVKRAKLALQGKRLINTEWTEERRSKAAKNARRNGLGRHSRKEAAHAA